MSRFGTQIFFILQANFRLAFSLSNSLFAMRFLARTMLCGLLVYTSANIAFAATAQGSFVPLPLPTQNLNYDVRDLSSVYSGVISGTQTFDNVPFEMRTNGSGNNALMTPIPSQSLFVDNISATTYSIPANIYGASAVYTLINSVYDSSTGESITFIASDGTTSTVSLSFGQNVRRYTGSRSLNSTVVRNVVGTESGAHLDMQRFDLPASFATKTLTEIRFSSRGTVPSTLSFAPRTGFSFLAGVTVDASAALELVAKYTMEEQTVWNGTSGELKDTASYTGGPFNGTAIGNPVPVQSYANPARFGATNGTCQYADLKGPSNNGGAFKLSNLPVNAAKSAQNSVSFWMYWKGNDSTYPLGWNEYKLAFKGGLFGFDSGDGRMFARSASGLANGWHHVAAVFTNLDLASNKLYIDGVLQTLALSGTQAQVSFFNPDSISTNVTPPATWGTGSPPAGWFTDNPSRVIEVNPPSVYGTTGATSNNVIEIEANVGDYNLYTNIRPDQGEELTVSVDYAARSGYTFGTDSAIDIYIDNVFFQRMNSQSTAFRNYSFSLGIATGDSIKLEFRSVDRNSYGGLITNINVFRNRAVATSSMVIGGFSSVATNRFIGNLDEVKIYRGAISQTQVNTDYADTHLCLMLHHARLDHNGAGVSCAPTQIAVRGCSNPDLNGVCTASVLPFTGTVVAQNNGAIVASAPFSIPAGQSFALVELSLPNPQTTLLNIVNYNIPPYGNPQTTCWDSSTSTASCVYTSNEAGFIVSSSVNGAAVNMSNQTAGVNSAPYYLRAVKTNTSTAACEAAIKGDQTVNFGYVCNNPTTCTASNLMKVGNAPGGVIIESSNFIARNNSANGFGSSSPITLTFDNNGNAGFWLNYYDVGQTTLYMQKSLPNNVNLTGNTNAFVTKPFNLRISSITKIDGSANPAATSASGNKFIKAGEPFKVTAASYAANGAITQNFGKEIVPEGFRFDPLLIAPTGGKLGVLNGNTTAPANITNGTAVLDAITWSEVGILQLLPQIADSDYLGTGGTWGVASENVGRFIPDHFVVSPVSSTLGCSNQFTYFGQDGVATAFTMTAKNKANGTTQNYSGDYVASSYMRFNTTVRNSYGFTTSPSYTLDPSATAISGTWTNGEGTISAKHIVRKPATRTAPASVTFFAQPVDDDGVTTTSPFAVSSSSPFRYGRLLVQNQHGSELIAMPMQLEAQYWDGNGYVRNTLDSCSTVSAQNISMKNYHGNLNACETRLSAIGTLANGVQSFRLTAPGVTAGIPNSGSVDLEVNLKTVDANEKVCLGAAEQNPNNAGMPWLLDTAEPVGRATFGRNRVPMIYMRENF
jgi:hypothetical protein